MSARKTAIVLFSGGLDSTVLLFWLRSLHFYPIPLTIDYRGRPEAERSAARAILHAAQFEPVIHLALDFYADFDQIRAQFPVPPEMESAPGIYLPMKNLIFYSIAGFYAEIYNAGWIAGGHHGVDTTAFPDTSPDFFKTLEKLLTTSRWHHRPVRLLLPFLNWSKAEIVRLGMALNAPLDRIWSCYWDRSTPCGTCPGCQSLSQAWTLAGELTVRWPDLPDIKTQADPEFHHR